MAHKSEYSQLELMQARVKLVPDGWDFTYIGKAFAIKNNFRKPISEEERNKNPGAYPYYGPTKIQGHIGTFEQDGSYVLIGEDGDHFLKYETQSMTQLVDGKCTVNNHAHIIEGTNKATREWFYYYFMHRDIFSFLSRQGAGRYKLNKASLEKIPVLIPPVKEQKKIAQILSTWDKAITTTEQLLANSQQQKKALMQQLLTGKKRLLDKNGVRFSGEWIEVSLSTICQINPKKPASPADGKVSFVAMEAVSEDAKLLSSVVRDYDDVCKGFTSFADNDVLVAKITPCFENGKGAYVEGMQNGIGFGSTEFHVLRAGAKSNSKYLYYLTNTSEFRVRGEANMQGSAGQKRVTTDYLMSLKVIVPTDVVEQQKIAAVLSTADHEISALQLKLDALKQEKKALMQQLLTGKRRVTLN